MKTAEDAGDAVDERFFPINLSVLGVPCGFHSEAIVRFGNS